MTNKIEVKIPDIGGAAKVDVIEVLVKVGDEIKKDDSLITLESDKASMEIPSSMSGTVSELKIKVGDKVSEGDVILFLTTDAESSSTEVESTAKESKDTSSQKEETKSVSQSEQVSKETKASSPTAPTSTPTSSESPALPPKDGVLPPASPAVRRLARELGVELALVAGSGRKARITKEDIQHYVKTKLQEKSTGQSAMPRIPAIDFTQFGEIEVKPLNKIKRLTGVNVHRSWLNIPHVTQFDEADITDLEAFRQKEAQKTNAEGYKLTLLAFVTKVVSTALMRFPQFNASLDESGENLIYKKYCHVGIAVETPNGLVVPVIQNVDQLSIGGIAREMAKLSTKAREKGLLPKEMSGGCFTISSLGGIGGTAFTPIVNAPEVAILGLSRSSLKPVYLNGTFEPRLMLPLSLSYDHRVIDGAEAARFTRFIADGLADMRRILL